MFLLNQGVSNIPHPYDISADDGLGGTKHKNTLPDFRKWYLEAIILNL